MLFIAADLCCRPQISRLKEATNKWDDKRKASHKTSGQKQMMVLLAGSLKLAEMVLSFSEGDLGLLARLERSSHLEKLRKAGDKICCLHFLYLLPFLILYYNLQLMW